MLVAWCVLVFALHNFMIAYLNNSSLNYFA